jgi:SPP1 family predicted phage head-tail adaptor
VKIPQPNRIVRIERATRTPDAFNEPIKTWTLLAEVWAEKRDMSDGERFGRDGTAAHLTTRFVVEWGARFADLGARDRVVCDGRIYDIHGVKDVFGDMWLEITAAARIDLFDGAVSGEPILEGDEGASDW